MNGTLKILDCLLTFYYQQNTQFNKHKFNWFYSGQQIFSKFQELLLIQQLWNISFAMNGPKIGREKSLSLMVPINTMSPFWRMMLLYEFQSSESLRVIIKTSKLFLIESIWSGSLIATYLSAPKDKDYYKFMLDNCNTWFNSVIWEWTT